MEKRKNLRHRREEHEGEPNGVHTPATFFHEISHDAPTIFFQTRSVDHFPNPLIVGVISHMWQDKLSQAPLKDRTLAEPQTVAISDRIALEQCAEGSNLSGKGRWVGRFHMCEAYERKM